MSKETIDILENGWGRFKKIFKTGIILIGGLIAFLILNPFVIVGAGERGVVLNFGAVQDSVFDEGLHLSIPIARR